MIKNIFLMVLVSFFISACSTNQLVINPEKKMEREKVSKELLDEIGYILFLFKQKDLDTLNARLINPKFGVYEIYKNENTNKITFRHFLKLDEISDSIDSYEIKEEEVTFDCSPTNDAFYGWSKEGVFLTTNIKPYLSQMMNDINKILPNRYKEDELKRVEQIEKTSYEVIVTYNKIFYLTKIDNKWYITLIDNVKTDCSQ
ncbi:hypothetical protein [Arcobacter ellisii]|uniref:Lipoprotein n=1 Tax=Arcobacter ellisii TaxID=913109 RepID=A0A347U4V7_9BACT|nr:hypothetical protein [Arcobacter ellisii]AXX93885.1 hypothetical protein AELL_0180 [Arcobacter ellisii]RXI33079.1 hypothetical protein CP962_01335 [Arcobacter ellisii]